MAQSGGQIAPLSSDCFLPPESYLPNRIKFLRWLAVRLHKLPFEGSFCREQEEFT